MRFEKSNCSSMKLGAATTQTIWLFHSPTMLSSSRSTSWTKTRADYLDLMTRLHGPNGPFRTSTRETPIMHVRFLAPDVAMMHSQFHIYGDIDEPLRTGIGTRVVHKIDGRWRTVAVQNTDVRLGRRH
jgi:hypothetical protein